MAQKQEYTRARVDPNGNVILERTYKDNVSKDKVLAKLTEDLENANRDKARTKRRIKEIQDRINTVKAL